MEEDEPPEYSPRLASVDKFVLCPTRRRGTKVDSEIEQYHARVARNSAIFMLW